MLKWRSGMQEIPVSKNLFINSPWEISRKDGIDFAAYVADVVTSKSYYMAKDFKKNGTLKKNAISKKFTIARDLYKDIAEHIVEAHNNFMHF
jgi:hypothetical protein